ncbi:cytochrome P450 [Artemisia annua]|uniref:Cytochrome P450 n=1 Tax=Artemisia annua TaxID=35608 RepID=A0A2U1NFU6_ARTAN|nr:cytochrome P450 [Artemisia annua]
MSKFIFYDIIVFILMNHSLFVIASLFINGNDALNRKRMKALCKRLNRFHEHVLDDHRARIKAEGDGFVAKDMVDTLLKLADDPNLEVKLDSDVVKGLTQVFRTSDRGWAVKTRDFIPSENNNQGQLLVLLVNPVGMSNANGVVAQGFHSW